MFTATKCSVFSAAAAAVAVVTTTVTFIFPNVKINNKDLDNQSSSNAHTKKSLIHVFALKLIKPSKI